MRLKLNSNPQGQFYFPKLLRDQWGKRLELIPSEDAGIIYPEGTNLKKVMKSVSVAIAELRLREEQEKV